MGKAHVSIRSVGLWRNPTDDDGGGCGCRAVAALDCRRRTEGRGRKGGYSPSSGVGGRTLVDSREREREPAVGSGAKSSCMRGPSGERSVWS